MTCSCGRLATSSSSSIIVTSSAHDFVQALLQDLKDADWRSNLEFDAPSGELSDSMLRPADARPFPDRLVRGLVRHLAMAMAMAMVAMAME